MATDLAKIKELFLTLLDTPSPERLAFLDNACAGDLTLRQRLENMLSNHDMSGELLPRPAGEMLDDQSLAESATAAFTPSVEPVDGSRTQSVSPVGDDLTFLSSPQSADEMGRLGHYSVRQVLGKGGFGIVFKAFDDRLHRMVAIKVLAPAYAANGPARSRFIREARAAAAVKNLHVVGIHDIQEDAMPPYIVMECIDGISLQDKIDKTGPLGVKEILRIGMQIAEGLAAAHRQGLVHRDIKPANILLENGVERVKITDFGLARAVDDASVTQSGAIAGTPMYMSPEQAEGLAVDHRSDLFSLGTVLYTMATGHSPFRASSTHAVLKRVIDANPRPIRENNSDIPQWLCDIITKLHAKRPIDRFATAGEVADLLGQHLAYLQQPATAPKPVDIRLPQHANARPRRRIGKYVAAGLVLGLLTVLTWFLWFSPRSTDEVHPLDPQVRPQIGPPAVGKLAIHSSGDAFVLVQRIDVEAAPFGFNVTDKDPKTFDVAPGLYRVRAVRNKKWLFEETVIVPEEGKRQVQVKETPTPPAELVEKHGTKWGMFTNPRGDCEAVAGENQLTLKVPGNAPHDLNPTDPWFNVTAPRVTQEVVGDFEATVVIQPFGRPKPNTMSGFCGGSFVGAGLIVWIDDTKFLRLVRAAKGEWHDGGPFVGGNWYYGDGRTGAPEGKLVADVPTALRVRRTGGELRLSYRVADEPWEPLAVLVDWQPMPEKLHVGVAAFNTTTNEFEPRFTDWSLVAPKVQ